MTARLFERVAWVVCALGTSFAIASLMKSTTASDPSTSSLQWLSTASGEAQLDTAPVIADGIIENDPFRLSHRPSATPFRADEENGSAPVVQIARPTLVLNGVVGGPPWSAIITGLPGRDGNVVVRTGDTFGALTVRSIARAVVVVDGLDTTWHLSLAGVRK